MKRSRISALALAVLCLSMSLPLQAAEAENFVRNKQTELLTLLQKSKTDDPQVDRVFDEILDYDSLAKETLAGNWDERSAGERREFQNLLKQLVRNAYRKNLRKIRGYEVEYKGESDVEGSKLVRTVAKSRENAREEPLSIDYRLHQVNGKWLVSDIVTEGSSLVKNYQNQFRRIIKKQGFEELLKKMKARLKKGDGD